MRKSFHWLPAVLVAAHISLLLAYTLPGGWVPLRFRYWSQAYSRVFFHQDWRLFAPDPPECGCSIEYRTDPDDEWRRLEDLQRGPIWKRMAANACRYAEASVFGAAGNGALPDPLMISLSNMIGLAPGEKARLRLDRSGGACTGEFLSVELVLERDR